MKLVINISPKKIAQSLAVVTLALSAISIFLEFAKNSLGYQGLSELARIFNVGRDDSIPTWYASFVLLLCALLLAIIARVKKLNCDRYVLHWQVLAIIFLGFSIDEVAVIHEHLGKLPGLNVSKTGFLFYRWVAVGIPLTLLIVAAYFKFLIHLPRKTKLLFVVAGALFIGGAIGAEVFAARYDYLYGTASMPYAITTTVEEFLEMLGVVVFVYALLSYISSYIKEMQVHVKDVMQLLRKVS